MQLHWIRFLQDGVERFGTLEGERVRSWTGDMFNDPQQGERTVALAEVQLLTPVQPTKVLALWNNYKVHPRVSGGLGIVHRSDVFAAIDNTVTLPSYTRIDAAAYFSLSRNTRLQANVGLRWQTSC